MTTTTTTMTAITTLVLAKYNYTSATSLQLSDQSTTSSSTKIDSNGPSPVEQQKHSLFSPVLTSTLQSYSTRSIATFTAVP